MKFTGRGGVLFLGAFGFYFLKGWEVFGGLIEGQSHFLEVIYDLAPAFVGDGWGVVEEVCDGESKALLSGEEFDKGFIEDGRAFDVKKPGEAACFGGCQRDGKE